ncbi:hypothetical protein E3N88_27676 [Mikania micrantha]|uniref:Uncharacterized protein n=1 Tax=Mikania micrantha TaxID=192012 RepID=A0A5N6N056_9ASTR|nr:hypothetical protein E3N88_27676 [Mikania micrantha]
MSWWDGDFFFGQYSDVSRVAETYQDETGVQSSEATNRPALPDLNEEVAGQTSYWQFDLNQEPCYDEDVNRECYGGEQSQPPQVAVKKEEADIVYQNMDWNTNEIFISVEELMAWVKTRALDNGYIVVTGRSKKKKGTDEVNKIWLVCDRGGEHNSTAILRRTGSKKLGCPFKLIGIYDSDSYGWKLQHVLPPPGEGADLRGVYVTRIARFNGLMDMEPAGMEAFHPVRLDRRTVLGMRIAQTFPWISRHQSTRGDISQLLYRNSKKECTRGGRPESKGLEPQKRKPSILHNPESQVPK